MITAATTLLGGVVVTFHPDEALDTRLVAMTREVDVLVIVDNSANPEVHRRLIKIVASLGAELIIQAGNTGLATALNAGFARLRKHGIERAIAFDQDSTPEPGFGTALLATANVWPPAAVVGANWRDEARPDHVARFLQARAVPLFFRRVTAIADLPDVTCVIASGTLFDLAVWAELGGFDDSLFLDLVDTDYCLRARRAGHTVRVAAAARLRHHRGAKRAVRRLGRTWWPAFMPETRLYYLFRNQILLFGEHAGREPHWALFEFAFAAKVFLEILFLEDRKWRKLAACVRGKWDGLFGRRGAVRL